MSTHYFRLLPLESWYTNLGQTPLSGINNYRRLIETTYQRRKRNWQADFYSPQSNNLTKKRRIETDQWLMTNLTQVFQPMPSWHNWPIAFNGPDLHHHRHYLLDSEDDFRLDCRNVSHQQKFFSELPSPGRSHNTNYRYLLLREKSVNSHTFRGYCLFIVGIQKVEFYHIVWLSHKSMSFLRSICRLTSLHFCCWQIKSFTNSMYMSSIFLCSSLPRLLIKYISRCVTS